MLSSVSVAAWWYNDYWQPKRTSLWNSRTTLNSVAQRKPAQFSETDLPLIEDYFQYNSFHHFISYRLNLDYFFDASSKHKQKAKEALNQTLHQLFPRDNKSATLKAFASPKLTIDLLANYLEQLDLEGVNKGKYQFDLEFIPRNHPSALFERETRAVSLWDMNQRNSIKASIGESRPIAEVPAGSEYDLIRTIATTDYPSEGQYYQYQGGVISFNLELDKFEWDASDRQSEKAENLHGDIIYRRYFKIVHEDEFSFFLTHPDLSISTSAMVRANKNIPIFTTVDFSRDFDGHTIEIPKERISIHFGEMIPTQKRKAGFLRRLFGANGETSFRTGDFKLYGKLGKGENGIEFEIQLHTLVYDLNTNNFNPQDSRLNVILKKDSLSSFDKASATNDIKRILLGPMRDDLIKSFSLSRFHPIFKNSGNSR